MTSFTWRGITLECETGDYNDAALNERTVEVPIARAWIEARAVDRGPRGLEVGNVLGHYGVTTPRRRVDRYEWGIGVENVDVFDVEGEYDWIVSVSTLEHVRWDESPRIECGAIHALEHLRSLLTPTGRLLVTVPTGCHAALDSWLEARHVPHVDPSARISTFRKVQPARRTSRPSEWLETKLPVVLRYGPRWANAVWIAEFGRDRDSR